MTLTWRYLKFKACARGETHSLARLQCERIRHQKDVSIILQKVGTNYYLTALAWFGVGGLGPIPWGCFCFGVLLEVCMGSNDMVVEDWMVDVPQERLVACHLVPGA